MTSTQCAGLISAALGAIGTLILFLGSYSLQPLEGGIFGSPEITEHNERIKAKNARRLVWQRIGLTFLCASFVVQAGAVIL